MNETAEQFINRLLQYCENEIEGHDSVLQYSDDPQERRQSRGERMQAQAIKRKIQEWKESEEV